MKKGKYLPVGEHLLGTLRNCKDIFNLVKLRNLAIRAAQATGATVLETLLHRFENGGATITVVLAESHLCIHTYPEHGAFCFVDIFTCGNSCDPVEGFRFLRQEMKAKGKFQLLKRKSGGGILWLPAISKGLAKKR